MEILPSEEQKWKNYYLQDKKNNNKMDIVYNTIYDNNINYKHDIALEYFANHINFANFFKNVEKTAKSFTEYRIKKGDFVSGRANDYSIINNKKIFNFDVENIILSFNQIKNCDLFEKNGILVMHLIPDKNYNKEDLTRLIKQIQKSIFEVFKDLDYVPFICKIRDTFPCAKSGKRDLIKLKSKNEGFFTINNDKMENYIINDNKKELKKILKIKEVKYEE